MKNYFTFWLLFLFAMLTMLLFACKKDTNNNNNNNGSPLIFTELKADNDTIIAGTTTYVRATASGDGLTFQWSATAGDILGAGANIQYAAPPCVAGINTITCTVKDSGNNSQTKTVNIVSI